MYHAQLRANVSYLIQRRELETLGNLCMPCLAKRFAYYESITLVGTWWGLIGAFLGPVYLIWNILELIKGSWNIARQPSPS